MTIITLKEATFGQDSNPAIRHNKTIITHFTDPIMIMFDYKFCFQTRLFFQSVSRSCWLHKTKFTGTAGARLSVGRIMYRDRVICSRWCNTLRIKYKPEKTVHCDSEGTDILYHPVQHIITAHKNQTLKTSDDKTGRFINHETNQRASAAGLWSMSAVIPHSCRFSTCACLQHHNHTQQLINQQNFLLKWMQFWYMYVRHGQLSTTVAAYTVFRVLHVHFYIF